MDLHLHDKVELKKAHPCGSTQWEILRVGMDIKLKCLGCGHELMLPRSKAEKSIRKILTEEGKQVSNKHRLFAAILVVILVISMLASLIVPYLSLL